MTLSEGAGSRARIPAPPLAGLPPRRPARPGAGRTERITVALETVTPILGGGTRPRFVDEVDVIRAGTVRGHLRFWWRALRPTHRDTTSAFWSASSGAAH